MEYRSPWHREDMPEVTRLNVSFSPIYDDYFHPHDRGSSYHRNATINSLHAVRTPKIEYELTEFEAIILVIMEIIF
jgi:hypothetical protein